MSVEATTSHSSLDRTSMGTCRTSRQRLCATVSLCTQGCAVTRREHLAVSSALLVKALGPQCS